jgi:hypothetical protein
MRLFYCKPAQLNSGTGADFAVSPLPGVRWTGKPAPMNSAQSTGLTPERLQMFIAGLSGMAPDEVRKAKLLFILNEISQLRAIKSSYAGFGVAQGCFAVIPFFWPILWAQRSGMKATVTLHSEQIRNAITVWRDDLGPDADALDAQLAALQP